MARKKQTKREPDDWQKLVDLIADYGAACRADEMKGGGDPDAIPEIEAYLELARCRINTHLAHMRRNLEG